MTNFKKSIKNLKVFDSFELSMRSFDKLQYAQMIPITNSSHLYLAEVMAIPDFFQEFWEFLFNSKDTQNSEILNLG
jgi:hypothetical protein